ncbi:MAG TPA: hypothetical protein DEB10_13860, partial [Ruminococcaceae bacterium]|nr:hypothetical protein [Oscillospiraceae bacterium]
ANSKVQIKSDMQLDRTGIGERRNSDFLNTTDSREWQRNDWNALVNLTARAYAKSPTGSDTFFGTVGWDGARLVEKMDTFSQSHTLFIKSTNSFDYSFEQDFLDRLLDDDSGAITLAMGFFRNPYSPECIIYYNYRAFQIPMMCISTALSPGGQPEQAKKHMLKSESTIQAIISLVQ